MSKYPTLSEMITEFVNNVAASTESTTFYLTGLQTYINSRTDRPPMYKSISRILRRLKSEGRVNYLVVNSHSSEYRALPLVPKQ